MAQSKVAKMTTGIVRMYPATSKSRGSNGRRTEHQIGEGFTEIDTRALVAMITTSYQKIQ